MYNLQGQTIRKIGIRYKTSIKSRLKAKEYYLANKEKRLAYCHLYYQNHKVELLSRDRKYYWEHKKEIQKRRHRDWVERYSNKPPLFVLKSIERMRFFASKISLDTPFNETDRFCTDNIVHHSNLEWINWFINKYEKEITNAK